MLAEKHVMAVTWV